MEFRPRFLCLVLALLLVQACDPGQSSVQVGPAKFNNSKNPNPPTTPNPPNTTPPSPLTITTASLPVATVTRFAYYRVRLDASGGTPPYTWAAAAVSAATFNQNSLGLEKDSTGQWTLWGWPGNNSMTKDTALSLRLQVADAAGDAVEKDYTLTVKQPGVGNLLIATQSLDDAEVGKPYEVTLSALGGGVAQFPPYTWTKMVGDLATYGLEFKIKDSAGNLDGRGVIVGTPTKAGTESLQFSVTDGTQTNTKTLSLTIQPAGAGSLGPGFGALGAKGGPRTGGDVTVLVYDRSGLPLQDAKVFLSTAAGSSPTPATTDAQGLATFGSVGLGSVVATAWYDAGGDQYELVSLWGVDARYIHLQIPRYTKTAVLVGEVILPAGKGCVISAPGPQGNTEVAPTGTANKAPFSLEVEAGKALSVAFSVIDPQTGAVEKGTVMAVAASAVAAGANFSMGTVDLTGVLQSKAVSGGQIIFGLPFQGASAETSLFVAAHDAQGRNLGTEVEVLASTPSGASPRSVSGTAIKFGGASKWSVLVSGTQNNTVSSFGDVDTWLSADPYVSGALPAITLPGTGSFPSVVSPVGGTAGFLSPPKSTVTWVTPTGSGAPTFQFLALDQKVLTSMTQGRRSWRIYVPADVNTVDLPPMPAALTGKALDSSSQTSIAVYVYSVRIDQATAWTAGTDVDVSALQDAQVTETAAGVALEVGP